MTGIDTEYIGYCHMNALVTAELFHSQSRSSVLLTDLLQ